MYQLVICSIELITNSLDLRKHILIKFLQVSPLTAFQQQVKGIFVHLKTTEMIQEIQYFTIIEITLTRAAKKGIFHHLCSFWFCTSTNSILVKMWLPMIRHFEQ